MMMDMLIIFIVISIILFILTVFVMDDMPMLAIPFIFAGMIFAILCAYGFFDVGTFYVGQNITTGNLEASVYSDESYGVMYPWVFFFVFILYVFLFVKVAFNIWKEANETRGQIDYRRRR